MKPVKKVTSPVQSENRAAVGICVALVLAVFAVFGRTIFYEFVNLDDNLYVYQNPIVAGGLTLQGIAYLFTHQVCDFYHPLTMLSLMVDNQLYGLNAGGYHLTNILLHATTSVLLFIVLLRMMGPNALWPCAFVAAIFAIHPLRVESVAWITERKDVLSGLFFVLTLAAYVRYVRKSFSLPRYLLIIFLFALGLLAKPSLVTLPFLLLLLDYWPLARFSFGQKFSFKVLIPLIVEKIPLFILSSAAGVAAILTQQHSHLLAPVAQVPILPRIGYAADSYIVYLQQMFWPKGLAVIYPFPQNGLPLSEIILALMLLAGISAFAFVLRKQRPYLIVGWLWYLGMLVPMVGIIHVGSVARADRFTYLAQIGVYIILAFAIKDFTASWRNGRRILSAGTFSVIAILMFCAWKQASYWRNSETLWAHTLACTKNNAFAYNDYGGALLANGKIDDAIENFQKALQINSRYAEVYHNLGDAFIQKGNRIEAIQQYEQALAIDPEDEPSHVNLGIVLYQSGRIDEAVVHYQKALEIDSSDTKAHNNLGLAFIQLNRMDEAIAQYNQALWVDSQNLEAHFNLGNAFVQAGQFPKAIEHYKEALKINPNDAEVCNNLGLAFYQSGNKSEAVSFAQKALQLANAQTNSALAKIIQNQLDLYRANR